MKGGIEGRWTPGGVYAARRMAGRRSPPLSHRSGGGSLDEGAERWRGETGSEMDGRWTDQEGGWNVHREAA